jgi:uncharacterized membrane protein YfcA
MLISLPPAGLADTLDAPSQFATLGVGSAPCFTVIKAVGKTAHFKETDGQAMLAWAQGYLSFYNSILEGTYDVTGGAGRRISGVAIGLVSGFAGVGGGIMTNIVMTLSGLSMHKSIGRAAAAGVVVGAPATIVAALAPNSGDAAQLGSINLAIWVCIAPTQAGAAWIGAHLAQRTSANTLSRLFAVSLAARGLMLRSSLAWH